MQQYSVGEIVEVWSNSRQAWIPNATVIYAPTVDCNIEGYDVQAGSLKVEYDGQMKWLLPDMVANGDHVRRRRASVAAARPSTVGVCAGPMPSSPGKCKFGCGRDVQPGLTRTMKPFDTCCKRCALNGGNGDHDPNCGGTSPVVVRPSKSGLDFTLIDARAWLEELTGSDGALRIYTSEIFESTTGGQKFMDLDQFRTAIKELLLQPVGGRLTSPEGSLQGVYSQHDKGSGLELSSFLDICRSVLLDYRQTYFPRVLPFDICNFVRRNSRMLTDLYEEGDKLGEGSFGVVHMVTHKVSRDQRVCKRIAKLRGRIGMPVESILKEIDSMAKLDHPNIIKVYEYFEDGSSISQIMEPCNGGELQHRIDDMFRKGGPQYDEGFICDVMKQTLRALAFMHSAKYMHKDLKPQNIMMVDRLSPSIKLIDFGLAELFEADTTVSSIFGGTLLYIAPEGLGHGLEMKSDVWSAGVILYNLITGDYPFMEQWPLPPGKDVQWWEAGVRNAILQLGYRSHRNLSNGFVSKDCVNLMEFMLTKDPRGRPDAAKCLEHEWFKKFDKKPPPLSVGVTQCLDAFAGQPELKKAVFLLIAHQCAVPALQELRAIFTHFDTSNRGTISAASIREVLSTAGMSHLRAARILHALDRDQSGAVSWTEFIAAALCISVCNRQPLVAAAFSAIDRNNDGKAGVEDLKDVFAKGRESLWSELLPAECENINKDFARSKCFTREQFQDYMKEHMRVIGGDAVSAVSM